MDKFQKTLTRTFVSKKGKVPTCMKVLSYVIVGLGISFLLSTVMAPKNASNSKVIEGLVNFGGIDDEQHLVYLHMKGCGHCVRFTPEWDKFAENPPKNIKVKKLEKSDKEAKIYLKTFGVSGFPTVLLVKGKRAKKFKGSRDVAGLNLFVNNNNL